MRDRSDRYQFQPAPTLLPPKKLGTYLMDAGLLTADQISVILNDQQATGMRFGEIVTARGWVKEQTIEWIVQKVVEPERYKPKTSTAAAPSAPPMAAPTVPTGRPKSLQVLQAAASKDGENSGEVEPPPQAGTGSQVKKAALRRESPIAKPLPPVKSPDGDVNWVG